MAIKAKDQVTIIDMTDVSTVITYYSHLSDGGFKYTVGPSDIDTQAVFQVALNI